MKRAVAKPKKGEWITTIRCTVIKSVYLSDCTEDEAHENPWQFSVNEVEIDMADWEVEKVERNA